MSQTSLFHAFQTAFLAGIAGSMIFGGPTNHARRAGEKDSLQAKKNLCSKRIKDVQGRHYVENKSTLFPTWINNVLPTTACQPLRKMHLTSDRFGR